MDKKEFLILDFCENFKYFSENQQQQENSRQFSLNEKLFILRRRFCLEKEGVDDLLGLTQKPLKARLEVAFFTRLVERLSIFGDEKYF